MKLEPGLRRPSGGSGREVTAVAVASALLAVAMTWPLVLHLGGQLASDPSDVPDPLLEAWTVAWGGHALLHSPLHFYDANVFWPLRNSLAFSESLAGFAPAGLFGSSMHAAVVRYNLLFLFAYALAFAGAYFLARELGARVAGAALAGAAFAYAPFRLAHQSHLHVLASGGIPLALALLVRGYRRLNWRYVVAGWLVSIWQISLGWNLGLPFVYLLGVLSMGTSIIWWRRKRPISRSVAIATAAAGGAALLGTVLLALPYLHTLHAHPEARRTPDILFFYSPHIRSFLASPHQDLVWGGVTSTFRLSPDNEKSLYLGGTALMRGLIGLFAGRHPTRTRVGLAIAAFSFAVLAVGFGFHGGRGSYRLLYDYAPGWQGLRTPGRLVTFTSLAVAPLAAFGGDRLVDAARRAHRYAPPVVAVCLFGLILLEGFGTIGRVTPPGPPSLAATPSPVVFLPADSDLVNARAMFWSIGSFRPIANGWSGFHPTRYVDLIDKIRTCPDATSVRAFGPTASGESSSIATRLAELPGKQLYPDRQPGSV